jgi:hypothetical protein
MSEGAFISGLEDPEASIDSQKPVTPLPVFRTGVTEGSTALVTLKLTLDGYEGEELSSISVLGMKFDGSAAKLDMTPSAGRRLSPAGMSSGAFVWTDAAGNAIPPSGKAVSGRNYFLSVAVMDGGEYDLDGGQGVIAGSLALAAEAVSPGTPDIPDAPDTPGTPGAPDIPDGGSGNDNGDGAGGSESSPSPSGGGCNAGAFGVPAMAAVIALRRKNMAR